MANLTFEVSLTDTWKDLTTESLPAEDDATYIVDIVSITAGAKIQSAKTDSTDAPTGIEGHPWENM